MKIISASLLSLMLLSGCSYKDSKDPEKEDNTPLEKTEFSMGTVITITLYDHKDEKILEEAFERVRSIEAELSINTEGTEIDEINEAAGKEVDCMIAVESSQMHQ